MTDIAADPTGLAPGSLVLPWPTDRPPILVLAAGPGDTPIVLRRECERALVGEAVAALEAATLGPTPAAVGRLCAVASDEAALKLLEARLAAIARQSGLPEAARSALGRRLATAGADRGPVRLGIGLLGFSADRADAAILLALGRCAELVPAAALALGRLLPEDERDAAWWALARRHGGSSRIELVRYLSRSRDPAVRGWLLRDGFREVTLDLYLAYTCAVGGDLVGALRADEIDEALLRGATDILTALMSDAFRPSMKDYPDGAEAVRLLLGHLAQRPPAALDDAAFLQDVTTYVARGRWRGERVRCPWRRADAEAAAATAAALLAQPAWRAVVGDVLDRGGSFDFSRAVRLAPAVGLDSWEHRFARLCAGDRHYGDLFETDDPARIGRLIDHASAEVAAAGGRPTNLALVGALEALRRLPGHGWPIVAGGLASPLARMRARGVDTLAAWTRDACGREAWPAEARDALEAALAVEPDDHLAGNMRRLLAGEPVMGEPYREPWQKRYPFAGPS